MWIQMGVAISLLSIILVAFGYLYFKMRKLETRFKIMDSEMHRQFNQLSESIHKIESPPITSSKTYPPLQDTKIYKDASTWQKTKSAWANMRQKRTSGTTEGPISEATVQSPLAAEPKIASERLMPSDLFESASLWKKMLHGMGPWILNGLIFILLFSAPFFFQADITAGIWAVAASVLAVFGIQMRSRFFSIFSLFLLILAMGWYFFSPHWITAVIIALCIAFSAAYRMHYHYQLSLFEENSIPFIWGAFAVWLFATLMPSFEMSMTLHDTLPIGLLSLSVLAFLMVLGHWRWPHKLWLVVPYLLFPAAILALIVFPKWFEHPLAGWGLYAWPVMLVVGILVLWRFEKKPKDDHDFLHAIWFLVLMGAGTWEFVHWVPTWLGEYDNQTWRAVSRVLMPVLGMCFVLGLGRWIDWPCQRHYRGYYWLGAGTLAIYVSFWTVIVNLFVPGETPFSDYPIFNPMDLAALLSLFAVAWWIRWSQLNVKEGHFKLAWGVFILLLFLWLNAMGLRYAHFHFNTPYAWQAVLADKTLLTSYAVGWLVFWGALGAGCWVIGRRT